MGGYCRLQTPLRLALGVRETVAGHRLGDLKWGGGGGATRVLGSKVKQNAFRKKLTRDPFFLDIWVTISGPPPALWPVWHQGGCSFSVPGVKGCMGIMELHIAGSPCTHPQRPKQLALLLRGSGTHRARTVHLFCSGDLPDMGGVPCAVRALCTRCAKSWPFSATRSSGSSVDWKDVIEWVLPRMGL